MNSRNLKKKKLVSVYYNYDGNHGHFECYVNKKNMESRNLYVHQPLVTEAEIARCPPKICALPSIGQTSQREVTSSRGTIFATTPK